MRPGRQGALSRHEGQGPGARDLVRWFVRPPARVQTECHPLCDLEGSQHWLAVLRNPPGGSHRPRESVGNEVSGIGLVPHGSRDAWKLQCSSSTGAPGRGAMEDADHDRLSTCAAWTAGTSPRDAGPGPQVSGGGTVSDRPCGSVTEGRGPVPPAPEEREPADAIQDAGGDGPPSEPVEKTRIFVGHSRSLECLSRRETGNARDDDATTPIGDRQCRLC